MVFMVIKTNILIRIKPKPKKKIQIKPEKRHKMDVLTVKSRFNKIHYSIIQY